MIHHGDDASRARSSPGVRSPRRDHRSCPYRSQHSFPSMIITRTSPRQLPLELQHHGCPTLLVVAAKAAFHHHAREPPQAAHGPPALLLVAAKAALQHHAHEPPQAASRRATTAASRRNTSSLSPRNTPAVPALLVVAAKTAYHHHGCPALPLAIVAAKRAFHHHGCPTLLLVAAKTTFQHHAHEHPLAIPPRGPRTTRRSYNASLSEQWMLSCRAGASLGARRALPPQWFKATFKFKPRGPRLASAPGTFFDRKNVMNTFSNHVQIARAGARLGTPRPRQPSMLTSTGALHVDLHVGARRRA